jgi:hypothetical protein
MLDVKNSGDVRRRTENRMSNTEHSTSNIEDVKKMKEKRKRRIQ